MLMSQYFLCDNFKIGKFKVTTVGAQSFTSLKADLHQDINRGLAFSSYLNLLEAIKAFVR